MKRTLLFLFTMLPYVADVICAQDLLGVTIDGLQYTLNRVEHIAEIGRCKSWEGELVIPEQVSYEGEAFTVEKIRWLAFSGCNDMTKVRIPKTIKELWHVMGYDEYCSCFNNCSSLERIDVDEENPNFCSIDGVFFNKDTTTLYCFPANLKKESYTVPDGVRKIVSHSFSSNQHLVSVYIPNSVEILWGSIFSYCRNLKSIRLSDSLETIEDYAFSYCNNLHFIDIPESVTRLGDNVFCETPFDTIVIRGTFPKGLRKEVFYGLSESTILYVQPQEIEKFKSVFKGTVLPLDDYEPGVSSVSERNSTHHDNKLFDLKGHRLSKTPKQGIYIDDGRKKVASGR